MNWNDLQPAVRVAIAVSVFVLVAVLVWVFFVGPMRARQATVRQDLTVAEQQLDQLEQQIESVPPATETERAAWQGSRDELVSRLGPEAELPLLLESLTRVADAQGVEIFVTSGAVTSVNAAAPQRGAGSAATGQAERVLSSIPGASYVPLTIRAYGDYESIGRFIAQIGRLGWVTGFTGIVMQRDFPEIATDIGLNVYFRPSNGQPGPGGFQGGAGVAGAQGGGR